MHINGLWSLNMDWILDLIIRLGEVMTVYTHYTLVLNALLFYCIFACEYSCLSLLLTICRLIVSKQLWIKSLKWNMSLVYCVIQSSFHVHDPPRSLLLTLELKGLSLIHICNHESSFQGKPTCSPAVSNHQWLLGIFGF